VDPVNAKRAHDYQVSIVTGSIWSRATGQARIGSLHDDDLVGCHASSEHSPLFNKIAGTNYGQNQAVSESEPCPVAKRACGFRQYVPSTDY
jgi:hypothetical protein